MTRFILALATLALILTAVPAEAQRLQSTPVDSIAGPRGKVVTDLFGGYKYLDAGETKLIEFANWTTRRMWIQFTGKTDSVKLQGAIIYRLNVPATGVNKGRKTPDTVWVDIEVLDLEKKRSVVPGQVAFHQQIDTSYKWISDVGVDKGVTRYVDFTGKDFAAYRIVTGINDTLAVRYRKYGYVTR